MVLRKQENSRKPSRFSLPITLITNVEGARIVTLVICEKIIKPNQDSPYINSFKIQE